MNLSGLELGLIISTVIISVFAIIALVVINVRAAKIKRQVSDGTYVSKNITEETANTTLEKKSSESPNDQKTSSPKQTIDYSKLKVVELKQILKDNNIKFNTTMKKDELIKLAQESIKN